MPIVKMICKDVESAFDLLEEIANSGGSVCMVMNGATPSRCLLADVSGTDRVSEHLTAGVLTQEPDDWDLQYFESVMK